MQTPHIFSFFGLSGPIKSRRTHVLESPSVPTDQSRCDKHLHVLIISPCNKTLSQEFCNKDSKEFLEYEHVFFGGIAIPKTGGGVFMVVGCYFVFWDEWMFFDEFPALSGNQKLNLQVPGCNDCGTAIHEMLHSMGMAHEQARPDRDTYVQIHWDHIKTSSFSQFTINHNADTNRDYDICSIMHYGKLAFSNDGEATISVKDAGYQVYTSDPTRYQFYVIGQRTMMTKYDLAQLAQMYQCSSRSCCGCQQEISEEIQVDHPGQEATWLIIQH